MEMKKLADGKDYGRSCSLFVFLWTLVICFFVVNCANPPIQSGSPAVTPQRIASVFVHNSNWNLVTVYLRHEGGYLERLGDVDSGQQRLFGIRADGTSVSFLIRPLASNNGWATENVTLHETDLLDLNVANYLPYTAILPHR